MFSADQSGRGMLFELLLTAPDDFGGPPQKCECKRRSSRQRSDQVERSFAPRVRDGPREVDLAQRLRENHQMVSTGPPVWNRQPASDLSRLAGRLGREIRVSGGLHSLPLFIVLNAKNTSDWVFPKRRPRTPASFSSTAPSRSVQRDGNPTPALGELYYGAQAWSICWEFRSVPWAEVGTRPVPRGTPPVGSPSDSRNDS